MDLALAQRLAGLDELAAGGDDHDPRAGPHADRAPADRREESDLRRTEDGARREGQLPGPYVAAARADVRAGLRGPVHPHLAARALRGGAGGAHAGGRAPARTAVGPLDGDDGLGAGRQRGARHDPGGLPGADGRQPAVTGRDVADDREDRGELLGGTGDIGDPHRVPVHGAVVERRQRDRHRHVLDEDTALRVEELELDGFERADRREDVGQVLVHRPQTAGRARAGVRRAVLVAVLAGRVLVGRRRCRAAAQGPTSPR